MDVSAEDKGKGEGSERRPQRCQAKKVVLATGSDARMLPGYKADDTILTNIEILSLPALPKSLIVIGSGAVGVEFASVFKSFGRTSRSSRRSRASSRLKMKRVSKELTRAYKKRGIDVNCQLQG